MVLTLAQVKVLVDVDKSCAGQQKSKKAYYRIE